MLSLLNAIFAIEFEFSRNFHIKWGALGGLILYALFLGVAGVMGNLEDDLMRVGQVDESRRFRLGRHAAMLASIGPFIYLYAHFAYQVNYHVNVDLSELIKQIDPSTLQPGS